MVAFGKVLFLRMIKSQDGTFHLGSFQCESIELSKCCTVFEKSIFT